MSPQAIGTASSDVLPFRYSTIKLTIYFRNSYWIRTSVCGLNAHRNNHSTNESTTTMLLGKANSNRKDYTVSTRLPSSILLYSPILWRREGSNLYKPLNYHPWSSLGLEPNFFQSFSKLRYMRLL